MNKKTLTSCSEYTPVMDELNNLTSSEVISRNGNIDRQIINSLTEIISKKDKYTYEHCERVSYYCAVISEYLNLSDKMTADLSLNAFLHDIGKVAIPEKILKKPTSLSENEKEVMQTHPLMGVKLMQTIKCFKNILPSILYHHERYDGAGYPYGIKETQIPFFARIISVADSYDAMTSDRPYRKRLGKGIAFNNLISGKKTQFDPNIVDNFIDAVNPSVISQPTFKYGS